MTDATIKARATSPGITTHPRCLRPGDQVLYRKPGGKLEAGFVTSCDQENGIAHVRFWKYLHPQNKNELRNKANSEAVPLRDLTRAGKKYVPQGWVDYWMEQINGQ